MKGLAWLLSFGWLLAACAAEPVTGQLVDYRTDAPIAGATVTVERRGWGRSEGQVVWDKVYKASTRTGTGGEFSLALPGPVLLTGSVAGRLSVEAEGYQSLTEVPVRAGQRLRLQTLPRPKQPLPGGWAIIGRYRDGTPFGWNFIDNRPTTDPAHADIFPLALRRSPPGLTLAAGPGGGIRFISQAEQGIAAPSYGHLLRYLDEAPAEGYGPSVALPEAGTILVRTAESRYAKLAFDPQHASPSTGHLVGAERPVAFALQLPFAYNPLPGRSLAYDPAAAPARFDPLYAGIAADLPPDGLMPRIARSYRLEVRDGSGQVLDRLVARLQPGVPRSFTGCLPEGQPRYRYDAVVLRYDDDGLPRVRLTVRGRTFSTGSADKLVGRRMASVFTFHDYDQPRPEQRELRLQELPAALAIDASDCSR